MLKKSILMTVGGTVFAAGVILFPLPVPFGLPIMVIGLSIMLKASDKIKRTVIRLFKKKQARRTTLAQRPGDAPANSMNVSIGRSSANPIAQRIAVIKP